MVLHFPDRLDESAARSIMSLWHRSVALDATMMVAGQWTPIIMMGLIFLASIGFGLTVPAAAGSASLVAVAAALMARLVNEPINKWADRPRPFESVGSYALLDHTAGDSFPSNHATGAFALAIGMHTVPGYNMILLALAIWLAVARLYNGLHYPSDVLVGALHGAAVALLVEAAAAALF